MDPLYHVSPKKNRKSIETKGLVPGEPRYTFDESDGEGALVHGVWVSQTPEPQYGRDVYEINNHAKNVLQDPVRPSVYIPAKIPITVSDIKRVGHIFRNGNAVEVHMHREENCDGRSIYGV